MLALLASLSMVVLSAAGAQGFDEYSETLFCREVLRDAQGRALIVVTPEVDSARHPLELSISIGDFGHADGLGG